MHRCLFTSFSSGYYSWLAPRKHVTLTLDQQIEIIKLIENGQNYGMIAEKYGIGKSTIGGDIKKK